MSTKARAYWVTQRGVGELRDEELGATTSANSVRTEFTAVSSGTERLVGLGRVPASCASAMACRYMAGDFSLPVKYGYSLVGTATSGALRGERVFAMHPHQDHALIDAADALILPASVPSARATLIPSLETALNAIWDAECDTSPKVQPIVLGAGAVGLSVAYVLSRVCGTRATLVELDSVRRAFAAQLPWVAVALAPDEVDRGAFDVAFHTTATAGGLQLAIDTLGFEGHVIELSWYGDERVALELGSHFHYERKRIIGSQVSSVAAPKRASHDFARRLRDVVALLDDPELDRLLGAPVALAELPALMSRLYAGDHLAPVPLISHAI